MSHPPETPDGTGLALPVAAAAPRRDLRREIWTTARLAAPVVGGQLAGIGLVFTDAVMAGRLGAVALAAVAVGGGLFAAVRVFILGTMMALQAAVAQLDGDGGEISRRRIAPVTHQAFWLGQGLALLGAAALWHARPLLVWMDVDAALIPTVTGYLKALAWGLPAMSAYLVLRFFSEGLGAARPTLYFGLLGLPVNALANYALMFGELGFPAMGAVGCGHATSAVAWAQLAGLGLYVARHRRYRDLHLFARLPPPDPEEIADLARVGIPIGVALFVEISLFSVVALVLGSLGAEAAAGHQVALNFAAIAYMIPMGIGMATTVRVGNAVGRRDPGGVRRAGAVGIGISLAFQGLAAAVMVLAPRWVAAIYTDDPVVIAAAVELILLAALFQLSDGLQAAAAGALRGLKDTRVPMAITVLAYWLLGLPVGLLLTFRFGLGARGMWLGLVAGLTVAAVLLTRRWVRISREAAPG